MSYKLAIFDMDGTTLNTINDIADAANYICEVHGYPLHSVEEYKYMVGNGMKKLMERALPAELDENTRNVLMEEYRKYYHQHASDKTCPYDGLLEMFKRLKAAGVKLAVNTNKPHLSAVALCEKYYPGIFDYIVGSQEGLPVKPAPNGVYQILEKAGMSREEAANGGAVYVGDSDVDVQTGKNAGIDEIGVDWGFRGKKFLEEHGAKHIAMNAAELEKLLTV